MIGVPDPRCGELPKGFVVRHDQTLSGEALLAFVAERVAPHKKLRLIEFVEQIPKSPAGKILRKELRARDSAPVSAPAAK